MLQVAHFSCLLLVLLCPAFAQSEELQKQVLALQGGSHSSIVSDRSGLILPAHPESVEWLQEFWAANMRPGRPSPPPPSPPGSSWWLSIMSSDIASFGSRYRNPECPYAVSEGGGGGGSGDEKRNLVIVPAGDSWTADAWLGKEGLANFDIVAIYHGDNADYSCPRCLSVVHKKGPKWRLYYDFTSSPTWDEEFSSRYDFVMLPDDDLVMDTCAINTVFSLMKQHNLVLAQPSVCEEGGSSTWRPELHQSKDHILRYTTFVEVMAPTFEMGFFHNVVRRTFSKYWTYVGWGLDSIWPALLRFPKNRIGVIDAVCMAHIPTEGGLGTSGKEHSIYAPGLSPYTAKQEELIVFSAYNYSAATCEALGEGFMSSRVVGEVWKAPRDRVDSSSGGGDDEGSSSSRLFETRIDGLSFIRGAVGALLCVAGVGAWLWWGPGRHGRSRSPRKLTSRGTHTILETTPSMKKLAQAC